MKISKSIAKGVVRDPLPVLTSLRFFAAFAVVIHHYGHKDEVFPFYYSFLNGFSSAGYQAVTFFFVLSGFILTYVYSGAREVDYLAVDLHTFIKARIGRIAPGYFLALGLAVPFFLYGAFIASTVPLDIFIPGIFLVPAFLQAWYPPTAVAWNVPAWSLSVEMLFYISFPLILRFGQKCSCNKFLFLSFLMVILTAVVRHVIEPDANVGFDSTYYNFYYYFPLFHLPTFVFGMALGRVYLFGKSYSSRLHLSMFAMGAFALMLIFGGDAGSPWTKTDAILVVVFGLLIFGAAKLPLMIKNVLATPSLVLLGESSYGIYILHSPIFSWWSQMDLELAPTYDFIGYFVLTCTLSIFSFQYFETPLRRRILRSRGLKSS